MTPVCTLAIQKQTYQVVHDRRGHSEAKLRQVEWFGNLILAVVFECVRREISEHATEQREPLWTVVSIR